MRRIQHRRGRRGAELLEFTFVGIPVIFILISIFEISRGMWNYHTLAEAVKTGTRFEAVRGQDVQGQTACQSNEETCGATVNAVVSTLVSASTGLPPAAWSATLSAGTASITCSPLSSCIGKTTTWAPSGNNAPGTTISISATYNFASALAMFWPGSRPVQFGTVTWRAFSQQTIQY